MTDSTDGGQGSEPEARDGAQPGRDQLPSGRSDERYVPGPRPGLYPPPPGGTFAPHSDPPLGPHAASRGPHPARPSGKARQPGSRRRPGPTLAQRQLMERISAGRKARQQRAMLAIVGALSAVVLMTAGGAWVLTSYVSSSIGRINAGTTGTPASGPLNILVAGVDVRSGLTPREQAELHVGHDVSHNSDTLMLAHIPADHRYVQVVSLPRDSWVDIPGHGMNKINAAYGIGGPKLMVQTVEQATGLKINDYIEVNFLGFVKVIDALGGVNVCLQFPVDDAYSGLNMSAGTHHVSGITALEFARDRHSFALSDLARISNQQQLLASLLSEAVTSGTLADPARLTRFLSATSAAVRVDDGFNVTGLANQMRGIRPSDVSFTTVPLASMSYITSTGQAAVLWNNSQAHALFAALQNDQPPAAQPRHKAVLSRGRISIDVYNGTMIGGLSASTAAQLATLGFHIHGSALTWQTQDIAQTLIEYPGGQRAGAQLAHTVMPGATIREVAGLARIRIVLGVNGYSVITPQARASQSQSRSAAPAKTAAQAACH
jgi:LCP family protein required for cell wall assembly